MDKGVQTGDLPAARTTLDVAHDHQCAVVCAAQCSGMSGATVFGWGVVGLARLVRTQIAPLILKSADSKLVACCGSTTENTADFAQEFGQPRCSASVAELALDPNVDGVFIASPNRLHHQHVLQVAAAGKHILCEKPFALNTQDAAEMIEACRAAKVVLRVAFQIRLEAILIRIREVLKTAVLGELRGFEFERSGTFGQRNAWRDEPGQGGALFDIAVHLLDQAEWLTGLSFTEVSANSHPDRRSGKADDTIAILGMLGTQCHAVLRASREIPYAQNNLRIQGTAGMLVTSKLRWGDEYSFEVITAEGTCKEVFPASVIYQKELAAFEHDVRSGAQTLPDGTDGTDGARSVRIPSAVLEAIDTRRSVWLG